MTTFRDREKERYKKLKPILFSRNAQDDGIFRGFPRLFCLASDCASENLHKSIRKPAIEYFKVRGIPWHDGLDKRHTPSNHLCCSQSCCVNFLYSMATNPDLAASIFRYFYPDLLEVLPIDQDLPLRDGSYPYMAFEWIGTQDYLGDSTSNR